ncbi:MAG: hypothetical protein NTV34_05010 [Proteobacteria bacterium]|nr:hypothetical protein [Pseudomonadota bacterium]
MKRLWRSVLILAVCFAAVVGLRVYLGRQIEVSKAILDTGGVDTVVR